MLAITATLGGALLSPPRARAEPQHALAIHGGAKHGPGSGAMPYVNPSAPKGGRLALGVQGSYDSLNPLTYKGGTGSGVREYVYQSLMERSSDEAFTLYGLIAESIDVPPDRSSATFVVRPEARFSDGTPITADDVIFSHDVLLNHGWPFMRDAYRRVTQVVKLGERQVRFEFGTGGDRELPLLMGLMPILPRHLVNPDTFEETSMRVPIGSGPYIIAAADAGRTLTYKRDPNWWAKDLPQSRGRYNFDEIKYEYFRTGSALFEAFKAGAIDVLAEDDSARWTRGYDFPAVQNGQVLKREFETALPAGMSAFVFNTRQPMFADQRVRQALNLAFDAEWTNAALYGTLYKRTQSFFERSELSSAGVPEDAEEKRLLAPFPDAVTPAIADGTYRLPQSPGTGANRANERAALVLLSAAGYELKGRQLVHTATGKPFAFEALITSQRQIRLMLAFAKSLEAIGITLTVREVDDAQYEARLKSHDFEMIQTFWGASLSPGNEQWNRWGSVSADGGNARNYAGVKNAAADAMITAMTVAETPDQFRSTVRAFDRVLRSGDYVIPLFFAPKVWVAHWAHLKAPAVTTNSGFDLETWWSEKAGAPH